MTTALLCIFILYLLLQAIYLILSFQTKQTKTQHTHERKISVLIPAYNEERVLQKCLLAWQENVYRNKEAIIINDGSKDETMEVLNHLLQLKKTEIPTDTPTELFGLKNCYQSTKYPEIFVIDQVNEGKSAALNRGIHFSTGDIIVTLDADSILEKDSLLKVNQAFINPSVIALGGMVHVGQIIYQKGKTPYSKNPLLRYQLSGYLSSFYIRKFAQSKWNVMGVVSGAFGAFRKHVLEEVGGFVDTIGEDMEITFRLQHYIRNRKKNEKMIFLPDAVCYTEVPETFSSLFHQRIRWQKGFIDCLNRYKSYFFKKLPITFSFFLLFESLLLSIIGLSAFVLLPIHLLRDTLSPMLILLVALAAVSEIFIRLASYVQASKLGYSFSFVNWLRLIFFTIIETVSYRLLDTFFFFIGTVLYFTGNRSHWHKLERSGNVLINSD